MEKLHDPWNRTSQELRDGIERCLSNKERLKEMNAPQVLLEYQDNIIEELLDLLNLKK